jgi:glycine/D-amino acid oxidase-like deaminating enzyme
MRTRYGPSPWIEEFPESRRPKFEPYRGERTTDIVVVGGGLVGCAIALALADAGHRPMLLEASRIGQGGAGRGAGLLLPEPAPPFRGLVERHGLRVTRLVFEGWRQAASDALALIRRTRVKCAATPVTPVIAAVGSARDLRREYDARTAAGIDGDLPAARKRQALLRTDADAVMQLRDGVALDPYRLCVGLARAAVGKRARIFERTPVETVTFDRDAVDVVVKGGRIRARTVVVATGTATPLFKPLLRHFQRRERYLVMSEPVAAPVRKMLPGEGALVQFEAASSLRVRWTADHRLLLSGAEQDETKPAQRPSVLVQRTGQLMYELLLRYPAIAGLRPAYGWDAPYGDTVDGLPYIGAHRNYPHHLFALGGTGASVTDAFLAARVIARAVAGAPDKRDQVFGWTR